ncbi:MAG: HAMP domain-containing histidine kinase [Dehalococcoidia bacterium]|jgi:signal transduction histidine kinase|nr:HAMP domain-containing histidine kinase [Dehalococcoidia bacterium]
MDFIEGILRMSDLFAGLSDNDLEKVLPLCREETYEAGTIIFSEGTLCQTMCMVESGKVALERKLRIGRAEESATVEVITRGGALGCSGLIDPAILSATGRALETTQVAALDTTALRGLLQENPKMERIIMRNLAKIVSLRLEHTIDTEGHVLSILFHDIKAPLAALESFNLLMLGGYVGELTKEQKDMLQSSSKRIGDLLNVVTNIMEVSGISAKDVAKSKISLAQVIVDSVEAIQPLADEKGLQIKVDLDQEPLLIYGAKDRLKQVVTNLLSNAVKFTPPEGIVMVKAQDGADRVQVEVMDTGIGIPAEELPRVFDDFYRGLNLAKRGAGLGLSISKRIIEAHQGEIWAVSPCPGSDKGSQFIFTLPKDLKIAKEK